MKRLMTSATVACILMALPGVLSPKLSLIQTTATAAIMEAQSKTSADVIIYGGTSAGVVAAIQVARMGKSAVLIEPTSHLGGLTSGGLGMTDSGDKRMIGGISREFYQRIKKHYDSPDAWVHEKPGDYNRYRPNEDAMWTFEPHVAEATFRDMLAETNVSVVFGERLDRTNGVIQENHRLVSIRMESGTVYTGDQFIDCTYEGDLMAAAGVTYTVGRESNSQYGETLNGNQPHKNVHNHRFVKNVDPYNVPGDSSSGLLPEIDDSGTGAEGAADHRVQAYCFRMCMSNVPANRVPFPKPTHYDERRYELLLRNFEAGDLRVPLAPSMMPNGKTDTNNNCAFSTDYLGGNYQYPDGTYEQREAIIRDHEDYQKGLMWTLANHPRVPESVRKHMSQWGLAKDEFVESGHWPHQLYIREARRMVSDYVVTEQDCRRIRKVDDAVGIGSYNMDSHNVRRYVTEAGFAQDEGDIQVSPGGPYLISYRSIIPAKGQAINLTVPVCLSATHAAYGSIRMEPVFMILGQSAATAAVLAAKNNVTLQELPPNVLKEALLADGQVLDLPANLKQARVLTKEQLPGIVLDDVDAEMKGIWSSGNTVAPYVGTSYLHDGDEGKGSKSLTFRVRIPKDGNYSIRLGYTANPNRAARVPVVVTIAGQSTTHFVDQQKAASIEKLFEPLQSPRLTAGQTVEIEVSNSGTKGHVVVDAVQILELN
ncbi:MAG: FAD-dependent oxidoreductase [Planctomycetaceae bacterium]|nr:FAD-dependent oxidoreductase [Planctomycetaceae bacterium]